MVEYTDATNEVSLQMQAIDSKNENPNEPRIIILGSSRVTMLDAVYIDNYVMDKGYDVDVYNGGHSRYTPTDIIDTIDDWILKKPDIVLLSVEMHNYFPKQAGDDNITQIQSTCSLKIPTFTQIFGDFIPIKRELLGLDLGNFDNPKLTTLTFLSNIFSEQNSKETNNEPVKIKIDNKQGRNFNQSRVYKIGSPDEIQKSVDTDMILKNFALIVDRNGVEAKTLRQIIERLQEGKIKVVIFTVPLHRTLIDMSPSCSIDEFEQFVEQLSDDYGIESYLFHEKYSDLPIWRDGHHITHMDEGKIYTKDVAEIIIDIVGK